MVCDYDDLKESGISDKCIQGIQKNEFSTDALIDISKFNKKSDISLRRATLEEIVIFMGGNQHA